MACFMLSPLPYDEGALEPAISARTVGFHYHKHHSAYVKTLNQLVKGTRFADMRLEEIVHATVPTAPEGKLAQAIERDFGGPPS